MRLVIFLLFISYVYSQPSGQCRLSSERCVLADFLPKSDARKCGPGDVATTPSLKTCGTLEICTGPSDDEKSFYKCELVVDANNATHSPIKDACYEWMEDKFCEADSAAIIGIIVAGFVVIIGIAVAIWYFVRKASTEPAYEEVEESQPTSLKKRGRRRVILFKAAGP